MTGVEEHGAAGRDRVEPARGEPPPVDDWGPPPWRSPWAQVVDRIAGPIRPWVTWFGPGRLLGGAVTVVLAIGAGWWLVRPAPPPTEARLPYADGAATSSVPTTGAAPATAPVVATTATMPAVVVVHVAGAVVAPGVVELPAGSRVADALAPAGGPRPEADLAAVNLATVLTDGQQVYVPSIGEQQPPAAASPVGEVVASGAPTGPVDLNRATAAELDELPGVGPATAAAIVAHRESHGPFTRVDDLEAVRGIGPAKLDALRDLVTT